MSFTDLKKTRKAALERLSGAASKIKEGKKSYGDDRFWKPSIDKSGNGYAVIRFLPAGEGNDYPWVRYWDHGFQGPTGRWYIEKSLTSLGKDDPVSEMNSKMWNSGNEKDKDTVRKRKRRLHYVSNILVVSDSGNPENEGKVFLYQYGVKIFDKINEAMQPEFEDETPINPFDFWEGANFKLKIRKVEGYRNYDRSEFDSPSEVSKDDAKLEKIYNTLYDLNEFIDPKSYKTYAELKTKLVQVLGDEGKQLTTAEQTELDDEEEIPYEFNAPVKDDPEVKDDPGDESVDDAMSYFEKIANEE